jgi:hypothetical protein
VSPTTRIRADRRNSLMYFYNNVARLRQNRGANRG